MNIDIIEQGSPEKNKIVFGLSNGAIYSFLYMNGEPVLQRDSVPVLIGEEHISELKVVLHRIAFDGDEREAAGETDKTCPEKHHATGVRCERRAGHPGEHSASNPWEDGDSYSWDDTDGRPEKDSSEPTDLASTYLEDELERLRQIGRLMAGMTERERRRAFAFLNEFFLNDSWGDGR